MRSNTFYLNPTNRAYSALQPLVNYLKDNDVYEQNPYTADYIIIAGDRTEEYDVALEFFRLNKPIIHFWAGEFSCWQTHDDVYRTSISLMSEVQLCVNYMAKYRNDEILRACGKKPNSYIVGNPYLDDMRTDDSLVPDDPYDLILYNPVSRSELSTVEDVSEILETIDKDYIWIKPNGDKHSDVVPYNCDNLERSIYLGLLKNSQRFITNSSSAFSEAEFFRKDVIWIGERNLHRDSRYEDMLDGFGCKERVLEVLKSLE